MELPGEAYWETWDKFIRQQLFEEALSTAKTYLSIRITYPEEAGDWN